MGRALLVAVIKTLGPSYASAFYILEKYFGFLLHR
jgi:hypothetical protein